MGATARKFRSPRLVIAGRIPDDASPLVKERASRRRVLITTGVCPCGAELVLPDVVEAGTVTVVRVEHEEGCPAIAEVER
jgi:hypothetical protein